MAYIPELEPNEALGLHAVFQVTEKTPAFHFAVSNQALYWPSRKSFAVSDPTYFKRLRNDEVSEVRICRLRPYGLWALAVLMVLGGLAITYFMYVPFMDNMPGAHRISGWPFAVIVGGLLMPLATAGRVGLEVVTRDKTFRWKPPLVVDETSKEKIRTFLYQLGGACETAGFRVFWKL